MLYYRKFSSSLKNRGFTVNPYAPCIWNRVIVGKQMTICFHVDDCKISHLDPKVVDYTIAWLRNEYGSVFTDGSGMMKVARGKVHKYLGMTLDFATSKTVKVTMLKYLMKSLGHGTRCAVNLMTGTRLYLGARGLLLQHPMIYSRLMRMQ